MFYIAFPKTGLPLKIYLQDKKKMKKKDGKNDEKQSSEKANGENTEEIKEMPAQTAAQTGGNCLSFRSQAHHGIC